jgi:DNA-binding response OmpR family regulator
LALIVENLVSNAVKYAADGQIKTVISQEPTVSTRFQISNTAAQDSLRDRTLTGPGQTEKLRLTSKEKAVLLALVQAKDNTVESGVLCGLFADEDDDAAISKHALEEMVARLRKKLKSVQAQGEESAIKSVWGVGYQLCVRINFLH